MTVQAQLSDRPFSPEGELAAFTGGLSGAGAVVSFIGIARPQAADGRTVTNLFLEHHPSLTEGSLRRIALDTIARFKLDAARVIHRCGDIAPGEPIVFVATASAHRRAAFEAADYMMDRLKSEAVFWKREDWADGSDWIEPTNDDVRDLERWSD
jgi:molybdopterin synthase catalytic subunit